MVVFVHKGEGGGWVWRAKKVRTVQTIASVLSVPPLVCALVTVSYSPHSPSSAWGYGTSACSGRYGTGTQQLLLVQVHQ